MVDCIVAMPTNLFYNVTIPVTIWILSKNKLSRKNKILLIDARNMGFMETKVHRELRDEEIEKICQTYHNWRDSTSYADVDGFCKCIDIDEIKSSDYILTPGRYIDQSSCIDTNNWDEELNELSRNLTSLFKKSEKLKHQVEKQLNDILGINNVKI